MNPPGPAVPSGTINQLLDRFEQAWQQQVPPRIDDYLRAADRRSSRALLHELIPVDLEYRWRRSGLAGVSLGGPLGTRPLLEEYLRLYPELGPAEALPMELISFEYRARHCWGDRPAHSEYLTRFRQAGPQLRERLKEVDKELAAEFGPGAGRQRTGAQKGMSTPANLPPSLETNPVRVTVASLIAALRDGKLLPAAALAEMTQKFAGDTRALARELVRRGWLTPYQVNQLLQGRGADLVLDPYLLLERLGEGGAGQVFKARHRKMNRVVALKLLRKELLADAEVLGRFYREIHVVSQLDHPNVVHAYDAGPAGASHFLAMEYVEGSDLARLVKQGGRLPVEQACAYIRQAALGLQHAHEKGLVHRDIKPHNLIMSLRDGLVKVADLGLARLPRTAGSDATAALTAAQGTGTLTPENAVLIGTADYLAPEQALDFHAADIRADIYSLGCTFFYLLTGQPPFPAPTLAEKLLKHQQAEPPGIEQFRKDVPAEVLAVLRKMLAKRPTERYQTPAQVAAALTGASSAPPELGGRRNRRRLLAAVCLLALASVGLLRFFLPRQATDAGPLQRLTNSLSIPFALVPAGEFPMGSPANEVGHEEFEAPVHQVTISRPFYLGVHEITVANFRTFTQATGYRTQAEKNGAHRCEAISGRYLGPDRRCHWRNPGWELADDQPVVCVTADDARAFCEWLSKREGKVYRLPTEAEWEYACRAGTTTAFHFGPSLSAEQANFRASQPYAGAPPGKFLGKVAAVGSYPANRLGLHDMHGNVWEWCADGWDPGYYQKSPQVDPPGPRPNNFQVVRGGSWETQGSGCRAAKRSMWNFDQAANYLGFRVLREVDGRPR